MIYNLYFSLFSKIYNRTSQFGIQNKTTFDFDFQTWKSRKENGSAAARIVNQLSPNQAKQITTEVLSQPKDPKDYQNRVVHENEQPPIEFPNEQSPIKIPNEEFQLKVVEIRTIDDSLITKGAEKQKELERQLSENTARLKKTKKQKAQEIVNLIYFVFIA